MNKANWVRTKLLDGRTVYVSQESAMSVKGANYPCFKLTKDEGEWQLGVWNASSNAYRWSQFTAPTLPEIKSFFANADLTKI